MFTFSISPQESVWDDDSGSPILGRQAPLGSRRDLGASYDAQNPQRGGLPTATVEILA